jgi:hypothetical protein
VRVTFSKRHATRDEVIAALEEVLQELKRAKG